MKIEQRIQKIQSVYRWKIFFYLFINVSFFITILQEKSVYFTTTAYLFPAETNFPFELVRNETTKVSDSF